MRDYIWRYPRGSYIQERWFDLGNPGLIVVPTADKALSISTMELTTAGREVLNLVEAIPDQAYVREVIVELKKHATVFHAAHTSQGWTAGKEVVV